MDLYEIMKKNSELYEQEIDLQYRKELLNMHHYTELLIACAQHSKDFDDFVKQLETVLKVLENKIDSTQPICSVKAK